jgi:hypothetical protein
MRMNDAVWALALLIAPVFAAPARADTYNFSTRIDDDKPLLSASDIHMTFSQRGSEGDVGIVNERRDQTLAIQPPAAGPLRVRASDTGGIRVQPSADGSWSALVCMAAGAKSSAEANAILDQLHVVASAGTLTVEGPSDRSWSTYIVLSVPRDVALDLRANNGDLKLRDVSGDFTARSENGPLSFVGTAGKVTAQAENGPIQFRGHAGDIHLTADNGPIGVELDAPSWTGAGLDAHAENGPVKFSAPDGLHTGVQLTGSGNSPIKWSGDLRSATLDEWNRSRSIRFGSGPVLIHLSTVNGPVEIRAPKETSAHGSI